MDNLAELELSLVNDPATNGLLDRLDEVMPDSGDTKQYYRISRVAALYASLGRYEAAENLTLQVLNYVASNTGIQTTEYARAQAALAFIYANQDRDSDAESLFLAAEEVMHRTGDTDDLNTVFNNIGLFYYYRAKYVEAERYLVEALRSREKTLSPDDPILLDTLNNLALEYIATKRYAEAEMILRQVLETRRQVLIPDHPNIAQSLFNLGMFLEETGRLDEAIPLLREQFQAEDRLLANVFAVTSENERLSYAVKLRQQLNIVLMKLLSWGDRTDGIALCFEAVLHRKGIVAEAATHDRLATIAGMDPTALGLLEELNASRLQLARAILDQSGIGGNQGDLSRLEADRQRLEAKLARNLPPESLSAFAHANRNEVAVSLPPGSTLLEFVRFQLVASGVTIEDSRSAYAVFVLCDGEPDGIKWFPLGLAETLEPAVQLFRAAIIRDAEAFRILQNVEIEKVDLDETETSVGAEIAKVLIERMRPQIGQRKRLFISPDGILNELPFEILPMLDGGRLCDDFEISYLSSGRELLRILTPSLVDSHAAVVVCDPDFDFGPGPSRRSKSTAHFKSLPDTRDEGEWVAKRFGAISLVGPQALKSKVRRVQSPRVLHLATHGFFLAERPHPENVPGLDQSDPSSDNPLLRSGVVLSGANRWFEGGEMYPDAEDGLLTAEDVSTMNLQGTTLVVLSA